MFRTVFVSIIWSSRLYIQQQIDTAVCLLASRLHICLTYACCFMYSLELLQADSSICLTNASCCIYSLELPMMDPKTVRNM